MAQRKHFRMNFSTCASPPVEGCPQDGVVHKHFLVKDILIPHRPVLQLPCNPQLKERAKALRKAGNLSEVLFWQQVNKGKFYQIDFDRQRIIGNYIVDFYVKRLGLVVEIDGIIHDFQHVYDQEREAYLRSMGLRVYRISATDVIKRIEGVMIGLEGFIIEQYGLPSFPTPSQGDTPPKEGNSTRL
jgi:very-short-patch-repair endonuclease